jgi:hypothetical protein
VMGIRFWRWAHRTAESLWHWIYYNRLPEGREEMRKAAERSNQVYSYSVTFVNSKGEEVKPYAGR